MARADSGDLPGANQRAHLPLHGAAGRTGVPGQLADAARGGKGDADHAAEAARVDDPRVRPDRCRVIATEEISEVRPQNGVGCLPRMRRADLRQSSPGLIHLVTTGGL
jgi:hypothetical protein